MPHLEEQFPPVNPLVLQRPDALDPPDREEDEETRPIGNRAEDEIPLPGSLADGIDRVTLSANARVIVPIQPNDATVPLPADLVPGENEVNPAVPELLDIQTQDRDIGAVTPETDAIIGANLQNFLNVLETRRREEAASTRSGLNPIEPRPTATSPAAPEQARATEPTSTRPAAPISNAPVEPTETPATAPEQPRTPELIQSATPQPVIPLAQNATREEAEPGIENRNAEESAPVPIAAPETPPVAELELELEEEATPRNESRFVPVAPPSRGPLFAGPSDAIVPDPEANAPTENTLGIRGNTPLPRAEGRVNILTIPTVGEDPPGFNIQETRNLGQGRTLSLNLETAGNDDTFVTVDTIDEALEEAGAILGPDAPAQRDGTTLSPGSSPVPRDANLLRDPSDIPGAEGRLVETSFLVDTHQVFEEDQETQALQAPAFPEIDPSEPFAPLLQPEVREEDIPAVAQEPFSAPPPAFENVVPPVAPPVPGNVEALDENPQALRGDNIGTDPALRGNRELRNFLQDFNNRIEPPEEVTEDEGAPVAEVQNNTPPPPPVFENLEAESAELLDRVRERQTTQGVTRPEEEHTAPPEPRTPESVLTGRGQNIDRFI
jgi:hypothetical protein